MTPRLRALLLAAAVAGIMPVAAGAAPAPARVVLAHGQHVYTGTGNAGLPALQLDRTARLQWRHPRGGQLRVLTRDSRGARFILLATAFRSGSLTLRAGTYPALRVQARGGWRLTVTTLARKRA